MTLMKVPEGFDHPNWNFELKLDGFRAFAHVEGHQCRLVSRTGHTFKQWPYLDVEIAHIWSSSALDEDLPDVGFDDGADFRAQVDLPLGRGDDARRQERPLLIVRNERSPQPV